MLVDTSVAVALTVSDHPDNRSTSQAIGGLRLRSRRPCRLRDVLGSRPDSQVPPAVLRRPSPACWQATSPIAAFSASTPPPLCSPGLDSRGIAGGSVYDALVGAAAVEHGLPLATRDRRALDTYRALEVDVRLIA